jgi:hypothetical protein
MNIYEMQMLEILKKGKNEFGFLGVKAEFEAEGTRVDEMCMLANIVRKAGLNLGIKIGGCEAFCDLYNAKKFGAEYIIAPMVETPYAVSKYIEMKNKVYSEYERKSVKFLFNLETITTFNDIENIIKAAKAPNGVDGVVFGRVDFTLSKALPRKSVSSDEITNYCVQTGSKCKEADLDLVVGGGVAIDSIPALQTMKSGYLTRFETRKVIFDASVIRDQSLLEKGIAHAVKFELLWLQTKQEYYSKIAIEDSSRIEMLSERNGELEKYLV